MKTTKTGKLLLVLCLLFLYSCENKENKQSSNESKTESKKSTEKQKVTIVAKMDKGKIVFTDKKKLITMLAKNMGSKMSSKLDMNSAEIDVSKAIDDEKTEIVQLVISSKDSTEKVSYLLARKANEFEVSATATIVTCTGCAAGCNPKRAKDGTGYCSTCHTEGGKCEKTETLQAVVRK